MKPRKTRTWVLLLAGLTLFFAAAAMLTLRAKPAGAVEIRSGGTLVMTLPLNADGQWVIAAPNGGSNTVTIKNGSVAVTAATCPDGYCMARGFCTAGPDIICLPNRLVLHFTATPQVDAALG